jgi:DNA-binding NarL/FixJ family response regulator
MNVAIIEDQRDLRESLALLVGGTPGFSCVGVYDSIEEALPTMKPGKADVALVDIALPGISGIDGIPLLRQRCPALAIVILTVFQDDDRIFRAICAGANGYMLKNTSPARLLESIQEVLRGGAPMSPEIARRVLDLFRKFRPPVQANHALTPHEQRILRMLVEGHNYKTAATELGVSVNTIAFHVQKIYDKLAVHSKSQAVAKALRDGLLR